MSAEFKKHFEQNMLDGDKLEDCGCAMLSAESVFEYFKEYLDENIHTGIIYSEKHTKRFAKALQENIKNMKKNMVKSNNVGGYNPGREIKHVILIFAVFMILSPFILTLSLLAWIGTFLKKD